MFNKKLLFPEFIKNSPSLLQKYCSATLWLSSDLGRTTSSNITFGLHSSNMNIEMTWITGKTWQKFTIASCNEELYAGDAPATVVLHKVDAPGQNCQTIPGIDWRTSNRGEPHNSEALHAAGTLSTAPHGWQLGVGIAVFLLCVLQTLGWCYITC